MSTPAALNPPDVGWDIKDLPSNAAPPHALHRGAPSVLELGDNLHLAQDLAPLFGVFPDHVADPYSATASAAWAGAYEEAVLEYFAALAGASANDAHGYVASSPSEALVHALAMARRMLPAAPVYVCDQAHPRVRKACELLRMRVIGVRSLPEGAMDLEDLHEQTRQHREEDAIVVATCGTRWRGAVDDVAALRAAAYGRAYVHVDAALGGLVAAHSDPVPAWSLAHGANSLTLSGYPVVPLPVPAGISLVGRVLLPDMDRAITAPDSTVVGSRGGLTALLLWARLQSMGRTGVAAMVGYCQELAAHAVDRFERAGAMPHRLPGSLAVTFERPPAWVVDKWRLECAGDLAQLVAARHLTCAAIDELATDLSDARWEVLA